MEYREDNLFCQITFVRLDNQPVEKGVEKLQMVPGMLIGKTTSPEASKTHHPRDVHLF